MKVSVVIPHYNDLASLSLCLAALERQTFAPEYREIIVADNASPQGMEAVAEVVANRARLVVVSQKGAGPTRNGGVAASRGEILAFIDSDCVADPQWLAQGVEMISRYDIIGGRVDVLVGDPAQITETEAFECVFAFDIERYVTRKGFAATCNLFCTRRTFDSVGPFRVGISEDVEWCHRATQKGFRIEYAPNVLVGHPARRTWDELKRKWIRINAETHALTMQRNWGRLKWVLICLALPFSALAHTPKVIASDKLQGIRPRMIALKVLYRLRFWRLRDSIRLLLHT